jgi:hypothetical protein
MELVILAMDKGKRPWNKPGNLSYITVFALPPNLIIVIGQKRF